MSEVGTVYMYSRKGGRGARHDRVTYYQTSFVGLGQESRDGHAYKKLRTIIYREKV